MPNWRVLALEIGWRFMIPFRGAKICPIKRKLSGDNQSLLNGPVAGFGVIDWDNVPITESLLVSPKSDCKL